jgi:hypothetical protein
LQVQTAADKYTVDLGFLFRIAGKRTLCATTNQFLGYALEKVSYALNRRSRQFYSTSIFHAIARLDVPTWDGPTVAARISALSRNSHRATAWEAIVTFVDTASASYQDVFPDSCAVQRSEGAEGRPTLRPAIVF